MKHLLIKMFYSVQEDFWMRYFAHHVGRTYRCVSIHLQDDTYIVIEPQIGNPTRHRVLTINESRTNPDL